jgi:hypothetical protein
MILPPEDAALFYRAWGALLTWVNDQRSIVPRFPRPTADQPIDASLANQIRKVVWAEDALRERFLTEGAGDLAGEERDLVASWKHRVSGNFIVLKHLQKHSIFIGKGVYAVLGIYTPLAELIPFVPTYVQAVLLPFRDVIITDGFLESPPMQISFGGGARRVFQTEYSAARTASQIRTKLPWHAEPAPAPVATPKKPLRKPSRGRTQRRSGPAR